MTEWDRLVHPTEETARPYEKYAVEYAQMVVKSAFLLLGGGLVSLAPITQHVSVGAIDKLVAAAVLFLCGLACTAGCAALAYANFAVLAATVRHQSTVTDYSLRGIYGYVPQPGEDHPEALDAAAKAKNGNAIARWTTRVSVTLGLAAYVFLVIGGLQIARAVQQDWHGHSSPVAAQTAPSR